MSTESLPQRDSKFQEYHQIWAQSITRVLQEVAGTPFNAQEIADDKTNTRIDELVSQGLWIRFELAESLTGEHSFLLSREGGLCLAELLLGEAQNPAGELTDDHRGALAELFRQFAGAAGIALKGLAGGEVKLQYGGSEHPHDEPIERVGYELSSPKCSPLVIFMGASSHLMSALRAKTSRPPQAPAPDPAATPVPAPSSIRDLKLDLLMDVELDATLRFGARQMLLRDVLELNAGSVVELDQHIEDPVELLVGGKVIARGEVVIVDGNYGLRVSEIISPLERIESLRG